MIDYQHCCREHSRRDARFRFCPECEAMFFRCPHCSVLITALGMCATCVRPMIEVPRGLVQPEGSELDLPVTVLNEGPRPFSIRSLTCRSGDNCVREDLGGRQVNAGGQGNFSAPVRFPRAGHFKLDLLLELEWRAFGTAQHHAARLGFAALLPNAIEITARHDGPLLHTEGTGHLVNVSGDAAQSLSNALRTCGPDEAPSERLGLDPVPASRQCLGMLGRPQKARVDSTQFVAHRECARIDGGERQLHPLLVQHVAPIRGHGQLEQGPGEARALVDQSKEGLRSHIQAFQNTLRMVSDLVDVPVTGVGQQLFIEAEHVVDRAPGLQQHQPDLGIVEAQAEQRIVQLSEHPKAPPVRSQARGIRRDLR